MIAGVKSQGDPQILFLFAHERVSRSHTSQTKHSILTGESVSVGVSSENKAWERESTESKHVARYHITLS